MLVEATQSRSVTFTRPATTPTFVIGQAVGTNSGLLLPALVRQGKTAQITRATLVGSSNTVTGASFVVLLFNGAPAAQTDAATVVLTFANQATLLCAMQLSASIAVGSCKFSEYLPTPGMVPLIGMNAPGAGAGTDVYAVIMANGAYVGVSAEQFTLTVFTQNES